MKKAHHHFSSIAHKYKDLRITDVEPILFIKTELGDFGKITGADVGCGAGRYVLELFHHLGKNLYLTCIDYNRIMLNQLTKNLRKHGINEFKPINASAMALPLGDNSLDVLVTFNAIHHFDPWGFLEEASRVLRGNGALFIYTRLRSQNRRNVWGKFFPGFYEKETRLYSLKTLENIVQSSLALRLESIEYFTYERKATLENLTNQAIHHHYSTFALYREEEFQKALLKFRRNVTRHFRNCDNVFWNDENVLFHVRKNME